MFLTCIFVQQECKFNLKSVVNAILHNSFLNTYLSRYNSVPLSYQCLNPDTISSAVNVNHRHELVFDQLQTNGCDQLSMSKQTQP